MRSQCRGRWVKDGGAYGCAVTSVRYTPATIEAAFCRNNWRQFVACCFDIVAVFDNNVEATFDFVERTKLQRKNRSTSLPFCQQSRTLLRHCCWCGRALRPTPPLTRSSTMTVGLYNAVTITVTPEPPLTQTGCRSNVRLC